MTDIAKLVNNELKSHNLTWSEMKKVNSVRGSSMNSKRNNPNSIRIIQIEYQTYYQVRIYDLYNKSEIVFNVKLQNGSIKSTYTKQEFFGKDAEYNFEKYKKYLDNNKHGVICYTV